jgi:hypothetical protein
MSDDEPKRGKQRFKRWVIAVLAPILYVLSFGPTTCITFTLFCDGKLPLDSWPLTVYRVLYSPLLWLAERVSWFDRLLTWYMDLF